MSKEGKKKKGTWKVVVAVLVGFVLLGACFGGAEGETTTTEASTTKTNSETTKQTEAKTEAVTEETTTEKETTTESNVTMGQKNALKKAKIYLDTMPFSYTGLIEQLEFEGYTHEEAVYGADNCGADWNEQAAKKAQVYLDMMAFSKEGLIEQLEFEGYTHEQAVYGAEAVGY